MVSGAPKAHRKSGKRKRHLSPKSRLRRDNLILGELLKSKEIGKYLITACGKRVEPLLVYSYFPFPVLFQSYSSEHLERMPRWDELTPWLKLQICILLFSEFNSLFQTFTIHIHSDKASKWIDSGDDIRIMVRDRLRREIDKKLCPKREFFFVVEGLSRKTLNPTKLHIHGGIVLRDRSEADDALRAAERAVGQGIRGYSKEPRSAQRKPFYGGGSRWGDYLLKFVDIPDERLAEKRLAMSQPTIAAGREFWNLITGRSGAEAKLRDLMAEQGLLE